METNDSTKFATLELVQFRIIAIKQAHIIAADSACNTDNSRNDNYLASSTGPNTSPVIAPGTSTNYGVLSRTTQSRVIFSVGGEKTAPWPKIRTASDHEAITPLKLKQNKHMCIYTRN